MIETRDGKNVYYDMNGDEIKEGDTIVCVTDESEEKVYSCGDDDLGICATNPEYLKYHPYANIEYYPLYQFDVRGEWYIKK